MRAGGRVVNGQQRHGEIEHLGVFADLRVLHSCGKSLLFEVMGVGVGDGQCFSDVNSSLHLKAGAPLAHLGGCRAVHVDRACECCCEDINAR